MRSTVISLFLLLCFTGLPWSPVDLGAEELSFSRAVELADGGSESQLLGASAVRRSELALAESRSRLGPQVSVQTAAGYTAHPPLTITVQPGGLSQVPLIPATALTFPEDKPGGYFELALQLNQPLYTWGKLESSVELAGLSVEASKAELAAGKRRVRLDLHRAYFASILARESLDPLRQILDILREIEEDRRRAVELGSENRVPLLQIQVQIAEIERGIVQAEQAEASALEAVALYTNLHPQSLLLTSEFRREHPELSEGELKGSALASSPALKKALLEQERARANLSRIRGGANFRPDITLNLSVELSGQTVPWSGSGWEESWDVNLIAGVGAQGSLFDSRGSRHEIHRAEEALSAGGLAVDLLSKQIRLQTRQTVEALELRWAQLQEAEAALVLAEEEDNNAGRGFEEGLLTREQRGLARIAVIRRELELLERRYLFERTLYELESLAGFP